jgi:hypothetical protein
MRLGEARILYGPERSLAEAASGLYYLLDELRKLSLLTISYRSRIRFVEDCDWPLFNPEVDTIGGGCDLSAFQDAEAEWLRAEQSAEPNDDREWPYHPDGFQAARRSYRWCRPPTCATLTILPAAGGDIERVSGQSLSSAI